MTTRDKAVALYDAGPLNVRCRAHKKNGEQCKRWAVRGATVCATHGGSAPQVRRKAAERIEASLDRAAKAVVQLMESPDTPPAIKLAAAKDLLDRGNLGAKQMLEVQTPAPWMVLLQGITVSGRGPEPEADDVVLGEVVAPAPSSRRMQTDDEAPPRYADPGRTRSVRFGR